MTERFTAGSTTDCFLKVDQSLDAGAKSLGRLSTGLSPSWYDPVGAAKANQHVPRSEQVERCGADEDSINWAERDEQDARVEAI